MNPDGSFSAAAFEQKLREAAAALDTAVDLLEAAPADAFAPPGAAYLLARLHLALEIVELELPEHKKAQQIISAAAVADSVEPNWRSVFREGGTRL